MLFSFYFQINKQKQLLQWDQFTSVTEPNIL